MTRLDLQREVARWEAWVRGIDEICLYSRDIGQSAPLPAPIVRGVQRLVYKHILRLEARAAKLRGEGGE